MSIIGCSPLVGGSLAGDAQERFLDQRLQRAPDALLAGQHDEHEHEADHQLPIPEHLAEHVLHAGINDRTDKRPVQRADAAEDRHHHGVGGARRTGDLRADEAEIDGVHRPGQRGGRVGDDKSV